MEIKKYFSNKIERKKYPQLNNELHTYNIHILEREKEVSYYVSLINIMLFNLKSNE